MTKIIRKVTPKKQPVMKRKRVAAYARVSSGKDAMLHSLSAQVSYYSTLIQKEPEWEYVGVYTDEAVTGTKGNRSEFQRMLADCHAGKIDMIITKSISRFARNTVTLLENVRELTSSISGYLEHAEDPSLGGFLDEVALYTDLDSVEDGENCVTLMTMHAAKGLEYPVVFVVGMEEGVFPGFRSIGEAEELEEERRLCYVALTRAKERLHLTCAAQRMLFGRTTANLPSRFVKEIPETLVTFSGRQRQQPQRDFFQDDWNEHTFSSSQARPTRQAFSQAPSPAPSPRPRPSGTHVSASAYRTPASKASALPQLNKGDMIRHSAFGTGMILSIQPMGGDALVEVAFDNVGTKRMMLKAAAQFISKL